VSAAQLASQSVNTDLYQSHCLAPDNQLQNRYPQSATTSTQVAQLENSAASQLVQNGISNGLQQTPQETPESACETLSMTKIVQVGRILQLLVQRGDQTPISNAFITPFHSHEVPNIDILFYHVVLSHKAGLYDAQSPAVLILIERLCQTAALKGIPIMVNSYTIHR